MEKKLATHILSTDTLRLGGSETEHLLLRPHACGIVYLLTSNSTGRRQHLSNDVLKLFYLTGASLSIC